MNEFKYQLVNILLLAILGFGVYWAFMHIDNKIIYDRNDTVVETRSEEKLREENKKDIIPFENVKTSEEVKELEKKEDLKESANEKLIKELQVLKDKKIIFSLGGNGEGVGKIQEFLNIYNGDNLKIDKDYGPTTKKRVIDFQKKELGGGDGRVGPNTLKAMINWIEEKKS